MRTLTCAVSPCWPYPALDRSSDMGCSLHGAGHMNPLHSNFHGNLFSPSFPPPSISQSPLDAGPQQKSKGGPRTFKSTSVVLRGFPSLRSPSFPHCSWSPRLSFSFPSRIICTDRLRKLPVRTVRAGRPLRSSARAARMEGLRGRVLLMFLGARPRERL